MMVRDDNMGIDGNEHGLSERGRQRHQRMRTDGNGNEGSRKSFWAGEVFGAFDKSFLDEGYCRNWVLKRLHQGQIICPGCGAAVWGKALQRFWEADRVRCKGCGKFFTALTGTFLASCHMDFREIVLLAFLLEAGLSNSQIGERIMKTPDMVRMWRRRFGLLIGQEAITALKAAIKELVEPTAEARREAEELGIKFEGPDRKDEE